MKVFDAIKKRGCIRSFDRTKKVSDNQIIKLLKAASYAPSAGNLQSYLIVVVKNNDLKKKLAKASLLQMFIAKASVVFVVCADLKRSARLYLKRGRDLYCIQDATIAAQNVFLTATEMGLGACWVGAFNENKVRKILLLEERFRPIAIMPIGHPVSYPKARSRRKIEDISKII